MEEELISLAVIALLASITPLLARIVPRKLVPETVFLLFAGALCGPHMLACAGDTCLNDVAAGRLVARLSSRTSCQPLSASRKLM